MKVLYFGDVFGQPGREAVRRALVQLVPEHRPDFVVANGENMAHGRGLTGRQAEEFHQLGVDVITTGNHAWDQKEIIPFMDQNPWVIRPANYPEGMDEPAPGQGSVVVRGRRSFGLALGVLQVMGRVFMDPLECPFRAADREIEKLLADGAQCILADVHGEATSEKQALAHYLDGRVAAVVGSHSHVQTADERILAGGTAAITDVGMCGCFDSVIGIRKELSIQKFMTKRPVKYEPADGPGGYGAVVIDMDEDTGRAREILRLREVIAY